MTMYEQCLSRMHERGNDNAFILYGVAILRASMDMDYNDFEQRAHSVEARYQQRNNSKASSYILASEVFKFAAVEADNSGRSWHNYALCR